MKRILLSTLCIGVLLFNACKKDDSAAPDNTDTTPNIQIINGEVAPADGNGSFAAVHSVNAFMGNNNDVLYEQDLYIATGAFYNSIPVTGYIDGGDVILNSTDTLVNIGGMYMLSSSSNLIQGGNNWSITGNVATGVSPFTYTGGTVFPHFSLWDAKSNYTKADGITITVPASFSNTDTLVFVIGSYNDQSKKVFKMASVQSNTFTFSAAELASIPTGQISVQLIAVDMDITNVNGKKYYFFNEYQRTATANLN